MTLVNLIVAALACIGTGTVISFIVLGWPTRKPKPLPPPDPLPLAASACGWLRCPHCGFASRTERFPDGHVEQEVVESLVEMGVIH